MRIITTAALLAAFFALLLIGCSRQDVPPGGPTGPDLDLPGLSADKTGQVFVINDYALRYDGAESIEGATTYHYTLYGTGDGESLNWLAIEAPPCAGDLLAFAPDSNATFGPVPDQDYSGMKWRLGMWQHNTTGRAYSLTYPGQPAEGRVRASIKTGGTTIETALVPGPCSGYEIAGRVFVDPDSSGTRDPGEDSGIADVVVEMHDGAGRVFTTVTGSDGGYRFLTSLGTFTIEIDTTDHLDHFNDDLQDGFAPTTPLTRVVTVGPDGLQDVDFGVVPVYLDLIEDIVEEELVSPGLDIVFWRDQLFAASRHSPPDTIEVVYDRPTLLGFLSEIEGLWLEDPFRFADGRETQDALLMLSGAPTEPLDLLRMELLAAELNFVAGLTLVGEADLHAVLCAWGEGLVVDTESEGDVPAGIVKPPLFDGEIATKAGGISRVILRRPIYEIEQATILFHLMNTGGGGGVDEK